MKFYPSPGLCKFIPQNLGSPRRLVTIAFHSSHLTSLSPGDLTNLLCSLICTHPQPLDANTCYSHCLIPISCQLGNFQASSVGSHIGRYPANQLARNLRNYLDSHLVIHLGSHWARKSPKHPTEPLCDLF